MARRFSIRPQLFSPFCLGVDRLGLFACFQKIEEQLAEEEKR